MSAYACTKRAPRGSNVGEAARWLPPAKKFKQQGSVRMPRPKAVVPKSLLKAWIPLEQRARLDLHLVSDLEGRVPLGRYSEFVAQRLQEFFDWPQLDLSLYGYPAGYFVRGPADMILALKAKLEEAHRAKS